jgi:hypothetical protein
MKKCTTYTLGQTTIKRVPDYDADTSYLGEYTDKYQPGCIVRYDHSFYEDHIDDEEYEPQKPRREYAFFMPPDSGEKIGTELYRKYALEDYNLMEGLNESQWMYVGIVVTTVIKTDTGLSDDVFNSLWGIEDHFDKESQDYHKEVIEDNKAEVKNQLLEMGFKDEEIEESFRNAKEEGF